MYRAAVRRAVLNLLRCTRCRQGGLVPDADTAEVVFGPLRCNSCGASYPVAEGVADLASDRAGVPGAVQRGLEKPVVARSYERYLRPALQLAIARHRIDRESEFLIYRSMLGAPPGPVLDLGCGTALFARRLARDGQFPLVIGLDVSKAMIEEGVAQTREAGVMVDFVRAEAPPVPFLDGSLGAVLLTAALHLIPDAARLFADVGRVLRPGGRFVASTYLPPGVLLGAVHRRAGLHPRSEDELRSMAAAAGLVSFERMILPPFILVKAEKPVLGPRA